MTDPQGVERAAAPLPTQPLAQTFMLESRPGALKTIYLDFGAPTVAGTGWNDSLGLEAIESPRYSYDANRATFSNVDLTEIQRTRQIVAEDFAPFDINVTTKDPGRDAIVKASNDDQHYGSQVLIVGGNQLSHRSRGHASAVRPTGRRSDQHPH